MSEGCDGQGVVVATIYSRGWRLLRRVWQTVQAVQGCRMVCNGWEAAAQQRPLERFPVDACRGLLTAESVPAAECFCLNAAWPPAAAAARWTFACERTHSTGAAESMKQLASKQASCSGPAVGMAALPGSKGRSKRNHFRMRAARVLGWAWSPAPCDSAAVWRSVLLEEWPS